MTLLERGRLAWQILRTKNLTVLPVAKVAPSAVPPALYRAADAPEEPGETQTQTTADGRPCKVFPDPQVYAAEWTWRGEKYSGRVVVAHSWAEAEVEARAFGGVIVGHVRELSGNRGTVLSGDAMLAYIFDGETIH